MELTVLENECSRRLDGLTVVTEPNHSSFYLCSRRLLTFHLYLSVIRSIYCSHHDMSMAHTVIFRSLLSKAPWKSTQQLLIFFLIRKELRCIGSVLSCISLCDKYLSVCLFNPLILISTFTDFWVRLLLRPTIAGKPLCFSSALFANHTLTSETV